MSIAENAAGYDELFFRQQREREMKHIKGVIIDEIKSGIGDVKYLIRIRFNRQKLKNEIRRKIALAYIENCEIRDEANEMNEEFDQNKEALFN